MLHSSHTSSRNPLLSSMSLVLCTLFAAVALLLVDVPVAQMAAVQPVSRQSTSTTTRGNPLQLFVEPAAGEQVIVAAINNAHRSIWMEMYLLTDTTVIQALEHAASQHVDVRVMLDVSPYGGGSQQTTITALQAAGVSVEPSSPAFRLTHEKGMVIDGTTAYIMSTNLTYSALNGKNREYGIIDTRSQDVQEVQAIFTADWNRVLIQPSDPALAVSPTNSRSKLTAFIANAHHSLLIEAEEMLDTSIEQTLVNAAQRGVQVEVILPAGTSTSDPNAAGIATLKAAGIQVKEDHHLYMHAKMMVADSNTGFVGSENFSRTSLDSNRELGLTLNDQSIIATLQQTFQTDWSGSLSV